MSKAYDQANGGWGKSKLVDGPTLGWFLDRAKAGDAEAAERIKRTLTAMTALIDKDSGGISQVTLAPDWSKPSLEFPMFAQQAALTAYARAAVLFKDPAYRAAADRIYGFLKSRLAGPGGGFYASMGMAEGQPGVDKRQYARETGQAIQGLAAYYDATGNKEALALAVAAADWALRERPWPAAASVTATQDAGGPYLADTVEMGAALLALHRSTGERKWLHDGDGGGQFHRRHLHRSQDRRLLRLGLARCQAPAQADQAARGQCHGDALLHPARRLFGRGALSRDRRGRHGLPRLAARCSRPTPSCPTCCWPRRSCATSRCM